MSHATSGLRKGAWTEEEDILLRDCIAKYGEGKWHLVPIRAGLSRCRKSCRLRWLNYLRPDIKRGDFSSEEVDLLIRLHKLIGNRWSLIAGRLPGRTANDVKNYWNTHLLRKMAAMPIRELGEGNIANKINTTVTPTGPITATARNVRIKPRPRAFSKNGCWQMKCKAATTTVTPTTIQESRVKDSVTPPPTAVQMARDSGTFTKPCWWDNLFLNIESEVTTGPYLDAGSGTLENGMTSLCHGELSNFQDWPNDGARDYSQEGELGSSFFSIDSEFWDFLL